MRDVEKNRHIIIKFGIVIILIPLIISWIAVQTEPMNISSVDRQVLYISAGMVLTLVFLSLYDRIVLRTQDRMQEDIRHNREDINAINREINAMKEIIAFELGITYEEIEQIIKERETPVIVSLGGEDDSDNG